MQGKTLEAPLLRRPVRRFMRKLSRSQAGSTSKRLSTRRTRFTGKNLLRHELRTPLTGILGMSELLQKSGLAGEQRRLALALLESGRQMKRLIDRTALPAPPGVGDRLTACEPVNGLQLLEQVIRAHWASACKKGIGLYLDIDYRLGENWQVDMTRMRQLLDNLLANAIKFTHRGFVLLGAQIAEPGPDGDHGLELIVHDTGIGIPSCDSRRIYSVCEQGSDGVRQRYGGSGLGLFVCEHITTLLGGRLWHHANEDGGSCFKVVLPGLTKPREDKPQRLRPALLAGLRCQLALREPGKRVVTNILQRLGVQVRTMECSWPSPIPPHCDAVICDSSSTEPSGGEIPAAFENGKPVLLSRYVSPAISGDKNGHQTRLVELPQPILRSNLEPLLLHLALQRAMYGFAR